MSRENTRPIKWKRHLFTYFTNSIVRDRQMFGGAYIRYCYQYGGIYKEYVPYTLVHFIYRTDSSYENPERLEQEK